MTSPTIQPLHPRHAMAVAQLHATALPRGFLTRLGTDALRALYLGIAASTHGVVWTAVQDDRCVGFVAGTADIRRCYRDVLWRRGASLLWATARARPHRPATSQPSTRARLSVITGAIETLRYSTAAGGPELLAIAVAQNARGRGWGRQLVDALDATFVGWGITKPYRVATDADDPASNAFYRRSGFEYHSDFLHHGRPMSLYQKVPAGARVAKG